MGAHRRRGSFPQLSSRLGTTHEVCRKTGGVAKDARGRRQKGLTGGLTGGLVPSCDEHTVREHQLGTGARYTFCVGCACLSAVFSLGGKIPLYRYTVSSLSLDEQSRHNTTI